MRDKLSVLALFVVLGFPMLAQQEKGDKEIAFQGTMTVPFQDPSNGTLGTLIPRFGYFFNARHFIGIESDNIFAKGYQAAGLSLLYRFYIGKRGSKFQPYAGIAPGILSQRTPVSVEIAVTQAQPLRLETRSQVQPAYRPPKNRQI